METHLSTGFDVLDEMLGGDGLPKGSVALFRGEPGTGKTTFVMQIAKHFIEKERGNIVFVCAEDDPEIALNQVTHSYWNEDFEIYFTREEEKDSSKAIIATKEKGKDPPFVVVNPIKVEEALMKISRQGGRYGVEKLVAFWDETVGEVLPSLLIVDSLNALIYRAEAILSRDVSGSSNAKKGGGKKWSRHLEPYSERQLLHLILQSFESWMREKGISEQGQKDDASASVGRTKARRRPTVLFTAEASSEYFSRAAASYSVDVLIELRREQPKYKRPITADEFVEWKEDLQFLQVVKGRGLPIQRRSCCYYFNGKDESKRKGIEFFPTYAAQGLVSLFFENRPQHDVIQHLRTTDIHASYPGVVVQEFTRSALQRRFAVRRYERRIPPRHPMLLSHVDEYWVEVLRDHHLLHRIPARQLRLYSLPYGGSGADLFVKELWNKEERFREIDPEDGQVYYYAIPQIGNLSMLVYRRDELEKLNGGKPPETWEEMEKLCMQWKTKRKNRDKYPLLIETQTYDTLIATALELIWSHGASWYTRSKSHPEPKTREEIRTNEALYEQEELEIVFERGGHNNVVAALKRLHRWIHVNGIVAADSTVEPRNNRTDDWLFARHWYSTWVDVITRKNAPDSSKFGVAPIPISRRFRSAQVKKYGKGSVRHYSCSGEWYLTLQRHSENVELGIDVINNLMSSRKITERAFAGAELPLLEPFYQNYSDCICFGTDKTYNEIRELFAKTALSRAKFTDYRKVARILAGTIRAVVTNPQIDINQLLKDAFGRIRRSRTDAVAIYQSGKPGE